MIVVIVVYDHRPLHLYNAGDGARRVFTDQADICLHQGGGERKNEKEKKPQKNPKIEEKHKHKRT